jgi:ribosomal protein S4
MDPMERVKLERRIDELLAVKNGDVRAFALKAQDELKAKRWKNVEPLVKQAEEEWSRVKPSRVLDLLVQSGRADTPAQARHLVQSGKVRVNDVILRKPFATARPGDTVTVDGQA